MSKGSVLFADNVEAFSRVRSELIEKKGYQVLRAASLDEAERILMNSRVHLAILDVRLVDDNDAKDQSGIELAKDGRFRAIPKIMLTGFPTLENVRDSLSSPSGEEPAAVAILAKEEGADELLKAIDQAFAQHVRINFNLKICWRQPQALSFAYLASLVEPDLDRQFIPDRIDEFEDLFRKQFFEYKQISILQRYWNRDKQICLGVVAFSEGREEQFIVVCGEANEIRSNLAKLKEYPLRGHGWIPSPLSADTIHYASFSFPVHKRAASVMKSFPSFFLEKTEKQVATALENLYHLLTSNWLKPDAPIKTREWSGKDFRERALKSRGQISQSKLIQMVRDFAEEGKEKCLVEEVAFDAPWIVFRFPNGETVQYPDPLAFLYDATSAPGVKSSGGVTLGGLDGNTIIVDQACSTWPTDFSRLGPGPISEDFIALEASLRFEYMEVDNLLTLLDFERQLLSMRDLKEEISSNKVEPECRKSFDAIQTIRRIAAKVAGEDLLPYYVALFYHTMGSLFDYQPGIRRTQQEIAAFLYRLLFSSMLCGKIKQLSSGAVEEPVAEDLKGLKIDEKKHEVKVDGKRATLTPTEYKILLFLFQHAEQNCARITILTEALGMSKPDPKAEKGRLNTYIGRIREEIEAIPQRPKYLQTVRGEGYILYVRPD